MILGATAGALGCYAFLRQQSLLGDAISHAALPGIALMFLCTQSKNPAVLLLGGALAGIIAAFSVNFIASKTPIKKDAALGIVLSVFFGVGLVLLTYIQKRSLANQAVLNKFLFGNASTLLKEDIYLMAGVACVLLLCIFLFWKEFNILAFDPSFAQLAGYSVVRLELFLTILLVLAIVIGLQTVGVVLMSTLFIAPAAAARQWTECLRSMVLLASFFGAFSGVVGALISSFCDHVPTGPIIVVVMSSVVLFSLLIAPKRGLLWNYKNNRLL